MRFRGDARRALALVIALLLAGATVACTKSGGQPTDDGLDKVLRRTEQAPWDVVGGVEQLTVTGAEPGEALTLYGQGGRRLLTLTADDKGQAQFAYLPKRYETSGSGPDFDYAALGDLSRGRGTVRGHAAGCGYTRRQ